MIKLLLIVFLSFCCTPLISAQPVLHNWEVNGKLIDSITKEPVQYPSIFLKDNKQTISSITTNEKGEFHFKLKSLKPLYIIISKIGYKSSTITLLPPARTLDLGLINLKPIAQNLKEVRIPATTQLVKYHIDKIQYNVQHDLEKETISALEMLRKVPLVSIDGADNIRLKGNTSFRIFINGKPSPLMATNPGEALRAMPAENIQTIEVFTNPPAKYDGEGLAGIINIVTRKKKNDGYNASVSIRNNNVYGPNTNINGTIKKGKLAISAVFGTNRRKSRTSTQGLETDIFSPRISSITQQAFVKNKGHNQLGSLEMSFEPDTLNLITSEFHFNTSISKITENRSHAQLNNQGNIIEQVTQSSTIKTPISSLDVSANYQKKFKRNNSQVLTFSYKYNYNKNNLWSDTYFTNRINYRVPEFMQENNAELNEHSAQIDYSQSLKYSNIEFGAKGIFRNNHSKFGTFIRNNNQLIEDRTRSNAFEYLQNIYSIYGSYELSFQSWKFKVGSRWETTKINADYTTTNGSVVDHYSNLLPSLAIQKNIDEFNSINLGYSERIERPNIEFLNPFIDRSNPLFITAGNPHLNPVRGRQVEATYTRSKKLSYNLSLSYGFNNNGIQQVTDTRQDTLFYTTYLNIGKDRRLTATLGLNHSVSPNILLSFNSDIQRVWLNTIINSEKIVRTGYQWHTMIVGSLKFAKFYSLNLDASYDSRYVLIQGTDNDFFSTGASLSRAFKTKRLNISIFTSNPFNKFVKLDYETKGTNFTQTSYNNAFYRRYGFNITYKLKNERTPIKASEKRISNDDKIGKSAK